MTPGLVRMTGERGCDTIRPPGVETGEREVTVRAHEERGAAGWR